MIAVAAFVVLGLGGVLFDHFFGGPVSSDTVTTTGTDPPKLGDDRPTPDRHHPTLRAGDR